MKITFKNKEHVAIGTEKTKTRFLFFPKILRVSRHDKTLQLRWLCKATWSVKMCEWFELPPDSGYKGDNFAPNTYGWKSQYWVD